MKARNAKRMSELRQLVTVIEMYKLDNNGNVPEGFCYMNAANPTCLIQLINGGYLSKIPHDQTAGNNNQLSYAYCNYDTTLNNGRCDRLTSPNDCRTWVITFRLEGDPDNYCISAASGIYKANTKPKGSGESSTACVQEY